jgi:hypothetical protein
MTMDSNENKNAVDSFFVNDVDGAAGNEPQPSPQLMTQPTVQPATFDNGQNGHAQIINKKDIILGIAAVVFIAVCIIFTTLYFVPSVSGTSDTPASSSAANTPSGSKTGKTITMNMATVTADAYNKSKCVGVSDDEKHCIVLTEDADEHNLVVYLDDGVKLVFNKNVYLELFIGTTSLDFKVDGSDTKYHMLLQWKDGGDLSKMGTNVFNPSEDWFGVVGSYDANGQYDNNSTCDASQFFTIDKSGFEDLSSE